MAHKCNGGWGCDGSHAASAAENRAYRKLSREQKEEQHRLFKQSQRNHRAQYHGGECCFRQLAKGKPRLARRLAQRWIKMQLAMTFPVPA